MKSFKILLIIFFQFLCLFVFGQNKIFFAASGNFQNSFVKNNDLEIISIFYHNSFVGPNGKVFDQTKFLKALNSRIPNKDAVGYAVLDWEGQGLEVLTKGKSNPDFNKVKGEFIKAIKFAKAARPNIKWSFYGIPTRNYWSTNQKWINNNFDLKEVLKLQDFISPSLYVLYLKGEQKSGLDLNYIKSNVSLALRLGKELNKPVYPFIYHRNRTPKRGYNDSLVEYDLWDFYLKNISETSYYGKKINGLIWWNSERVTAANKNKSSAVLREFNSVKNVEDHQRNIFSTYLKVIKKYQ